MSVEWYCRLMGTEMGPYTSKQLIQMARSHQLTPDDSVRRGTDDNWVRALRVKGLFDDPAMSTIIMANLPPELEKLASRQQAAEASSAPKATTETWHYISEQGKIGPLSFQQLVAHCGHGDLKPTDRVWSSNSPKWCEARKVKGLEFGPATDVGDR